MACPGNRPTAAICFPIIGVNGSCKVSRWSCSFLVCELLESRSDEEDQFHLIPLEPF
ncbi:hypothetical protein M413DRAFT_139072 [Hebeloma cylindrosporum]|uniref:Uncharacterized protein n=1 Tax=Hebeloma cylindrosporum TaxID=76867 RepID=A0A0C3CE02_HEBCY|nr:hypothetical protein M413DRAFT_139072 [Hebeloma cylindrosporum h7]